MNIIENHTQLSDKPLVTDHPVYLWLKQNFRKLQGKPPLQEEVLDKVVSQATSDENLIGILLFGSLASGTHTWKSDIDLIFIYQACQPNSGVANIIVDRVMVQYFFTSFETLVENQENVPYLLHIFSDGKILFDRNSTIAPLVERIKEYFDAHPEIEADWIRIKALHQVEKNGPVCAQTTIIQRWDELEEKYSGGTRKRTFFKNNPPTQVIQQEKLNRLRHKMEHTKNNLPHHSFEESLVRKRNHLKTSDKNGISKARRIIKGILIALLVLVLGLAVIAAGIYIWARMSTDTSLAARGIIWGGSQFDDWKRFPSREVEASDSPIAFDVEESDIFDEFPIDGQPLETYLEASNTTALIILHGDKLLYEGYFNGSSRDGTQSSMSVAKSFVSTLVGIAIEEGSISSLDDPVTAYIPELLDRDPRFEQITIRHLLMMTSGLRFEWDESNPFSDDFITSHSPNMRQAALNSEIAAAPGQSYHYNDYNPLLIGMVLERATGMPVSKYLETRLWKPMGAEGEGSWDLDSENSGFERMSVGINGRAIDFARLGWLFLNEGRVGDRQVIPQAWVDEVTLASDAIFTDRGDHANYYQNYWFLDVENEAFYAEGNFCQFIYVYPASDLVLVRHGSDCGGTYWTWLLGEIAQAIEAEITG